MIGPLFAHPLAPPGKGVWVNGVLTSPAPAATPTPAVPVATLSPSASDPSEKQASGDSLPVPRSSRLSSGGDERGAGLLYGYAALHRGCSRCGVGPAQLCSHPFGVCVDR